MTKFFFEPDDSGGNPNDTFFSALETSGVIQSQPNLSRVQDFLNAGEQGAESLASMKKLESRLVSIEYGFYQDNYAVHVTPVHPSRNLSSEPAVKAALREIVLIANDFIPYTLRVELFLPRADWKMKVISAVIKDAAKAWNFDAAQFEASAVPKIHAAVEAVCNRSAAV